MIEPAGCRDRSRPVPTDIPQHAKQTKNKQGVQMKKTFYTLIIMLMTAITLQANTNFLEKADQLYEEELYRAGLNLLQDHLG